MSNQIITTLIDGGNIIGKVSGVTYARVQDKIEALEAGVADAAQRIDNLITTPVPTGEIIAEEIIDARQGEGSVGDNLSKIKEKVAEIPMLTTNAKGRKARALITFVSDDASAADLTTFKPIFDAQGAKFCTAAVAQRTIEANANGGLNNLTLEQLLQLQNEGHEILSHGYNHLNMSTLTDGEIDYEMKMSRDYFNFNKINAESIAIPFGDFDDRVLMSAQKHYRSARVSLGGIINNYPITTHELRTTWIEKNTLISVETGFARNSLDHYKKWIDMAVDSVGWLIISTHSWEIESWGYQQLLSDILSYAKTKADIVTISEALEIVGNIVESNRYSKDYYYQNHFALAPNGEIKSNLSFYKILQTDSVSMETPIESFENFRVSQCVLKHPTIANLPGSRSGLLTTYKFQPQSSTDIAFSYQEFKSYGLDVIYRRTVLANGLWSSWYNPDDPTNQLLYKAPAQSIDGTMLPQDFVKGKKAIASFSSNKAGMPFTNAGSIEVDFILVSGSDYGYGKQIAMPYNLGDIYVRSAQSATTWSAWKKITSV